MNGKGGRDYWPRPSPAIMFGGGIPTGQGDWGLTPTRLQLRIPPVDHNIYVIRAGRFENCSARFGTQRPFSFPAYLKPAYLVRHKLLRNVGQHYP